MAIRDIKGMDKSKIELLINLEFERAISAAENLGVIPKQTINDRKDLAYSLYQAMLLYTKDNKSKTAPKLNYGGHDKGFIEQEP